MIVGASEGCTEAAAVLGGALWGRAAAGPGPAQAAQGQGGARPGAALALSGVPGPRKGPGESLKLGDRGVADLGPLGVGPRDHLFLLLEVLLEDRRIDEKVELAVNDVGIAHITVELLADHDAEGAEAAELGQVACRIGLEAVTRGLIGEVVVDPSVGGGEGGVAQGGLAGAEH